MNPAPFKLAALATVMIVAMVFGGRILFAPTGAAPGDDAPNGQAHVTMHVDDHEDDPITGHTVVSYDAQANRIESLTTDAGGNAQFTFTKPGTYAIRTEVPAGYTEKQDGDSAGTGICPADASQRCVTVVAFIDGQGALQMAYHSTVNPITGSYIRFQDSSPEPRLTVTTVDENGDTVTGNTMTITCTPRVPGVQAPRPTVENNQDGTVVTGEIPWSDCSIDWTPPAGYVLESPHLHPFQVEVKEKTPYVIKVKAQTAQTEETSGVAVPQQNSLRVSVATEDGTLVDFGSYEVTFVDATGATDVGDFYNTGVKLDFDRPGLITIRLFDLPSDYELVPGESDIVQTPSISAWEHQFVVRKKAPAESGSYVEPEQEEWQSVPVQPVDPPAEDPVDEAPAAPPAEDPVEPPVDEPPVDEQPEQPPVEEEPAGATAEEIADCFMYLEMYPELMEEHPNLSVLCETDTAAARSIISAEIYG